MITDDNFNLPHGVVWVGNIIHYHLLSGISVYQGSIAAHKFATSNVLVVILPENSGCSKRVCILKLTKSYKKLDKPPPSQKKNPTKPCNLSLPCVVSKVCVNILGMLFRSVA